MHSLVDADFINKYLVIQKSDVLTKCGKYMAYFIIFIVAILLLDQFGGCITARELYDQNGFDENYAIAWGEDHVKKQEGGRGVQLYMDITSGSGFGSKQKYTSGLFQLSIKTPSKDSAGVVTAFYLSSSSGNHDELDFEFLGNREGKPIILQTNIFTNGHGSREQRIKLWFDPSDGFHSYKLLWNPYHIVFFVDDIPIRIFKNQTSKGVEYPSQPMQILASLWNGEDWATDGGQTKTDWTKAPFVAQFQGFKVDGCASEDGSGRHLCSSPSDSWWNYGMYRALTPAQESAYRKIMQHMTYDYCSDKGRSPKPQPPECPQ